MEAIPIIYILCSTVCFFVVLDQEDSVKEGIIVAIAWPLFLLKAIWIRLKE